MKIVKVEFELPDLDYQLLTAMFAKSGKTVESVTVEKINSHIISQFKQWLKDESKTKIETKGLSEAQIIVALNEFIDKQQIK